MSLEKVLKIFSISVIACGGTMLIMGFEILLRLKLNYVIFLVFALFAISVLVLFLVSVSRGGKRVFTILVPFSIVCASIFLAVLSLGFQLKRISILEAVADGFTSNWINEKVKCGMGRTYNHEGVSLNECILQGGVGVLVRLPYGTVLPYFSSCNMSGNLMIPKNSTDFDYVNYLKRKKIFFVVNNPRMECEEGNKTLGFFLQLRDVAKQKIFRNISEPQASLLVGIIFGEQLSFSEEFTNATKAAGLSHVIAASGFNVSIVVLAIDGIIPFAKPKSRGIVTIPLIWIYAFLTSFAASMVRACAMTTVAIIAKILDINVSPEVIFFFACAVLILINPLIVFDLGFLLSVCATFGIMFLSPRLEGKFKKKWIPYTTISCILTTLPLTLVTFNTFSPYSIISNVLVLPIVEIVMVLGVVGLILTPFLYICWGALRYMEVVSSAIYSLPYSIISVSKPVSIAISLMLLILIIFFLVFLKNDKNIKHTD